MIQHVAVYTVTTHPWHRYMAELKRLATSAAFTGNCKAKAHNYKQGGKEKSRNEEPGNLRSADGAWVPSATIFLRVELPIVKPALARSVLTSADAGDNGFIPMERLQHGLAEVATDMVSDVLATDDHDCNWSARRRAPCRYGVMKFGGGMVMFPDIKSAPFVCACGLAGSISISIGIGIEKKSTQI